MKLFIIHFLNHPSFLILSLLEINYSNKVQELIVFLAVMLNLTPSFLLTRGFSNLLPCLLVFNRSAGCGLPDPETTIVFERPLFSYFVTVGIGLLASASSISIFLSIKLEIITYKLF